MPVSVDQPVRPKVIRRNGGVMLSSEQFLDWLRPGVFADLIGGQIFMHTPVNLRHATLVSFLDHLLHSYIEKLALATVLEQAKLPDRIHPIPELPRTANQKLDRKALRALAEAEG